MEQENLHLEVVSGTESDTDSDASFSDTESFSDEDEDLDQIIRCKWIGDGSETLDDLIARVLGFAEYIRGLKRDGWELTGRMDDDYGFMRQNQNAGAAIAVGEEVAAIEEAPPEAPKTPRGEHIV